MTIVTPEAEDAAYTIRNTPALLDEARGWVIDAYDVDPELYSPSPDVLIRTIARSYDGGCTEFVRNSAALLPTGAATA